MFYDFHAIFSICTPQSCAIPIGISYNGDFVLCTMCRMILAIFSNNLVHGFCHLVSRPSNRIRPKWNQSIQNRKVKKLRRGKPKVLCPLKLEPMISCWQVETLWWKVRVIVTWWHFLFFWSPSFDIRNLIFILFQKMCWTLFHQLCFRIRIHSVRIR